MLASIVDVSHVGYPLLFLLVMAESGGVPVPGETALIAGGVLASQGKLKIELVIALAAAAAIVGDNLGYLIGRKGGRWLLERPGRFHRQRLHVLQIGEPFFEQHGPKAVFFGRFLLGLRVWASWLAGATRMHWRSFAFWNACGGICWATGVGLLAYFLGHSAKNAIQAFGLYGLAAFLLAVAGVFLAHRRHQRTSATSPGAEIKRPNSGEPNSSHLPSPERAEPEQPEPEQREPARPEPEQPGDDQRGPEPPEPERAEPQPAEPPGPSQA